MPHMPHIRPSASAPAERVPDGRRRWAPALAGAVLILSAIGGFAPAAAAGASALAWGDNLYGQLGDGTFTGPETCSTFPCSKTPVAVSKLKEVSAIAAGWLHSLAVEGGAVKAWGDNENGELGNGTTTESDEPVAVKGLTEVTAISAGLAYSLALLKNGTVKAWGWNDVGQLGDGTTTESDEPVTVKNLEKIKAISAGGTFALALLENGTVKAWGENLYGQLGNGNTTNSDEPVTVKNLEKVKAISAGGSFGLALLENGTVEAWGENADDQLGDGPPLMQTKCNSEPCSTTPVTVKTGRESLDEVSAISAGWTHSLALLTGGTVKAWGENADGQLGDGNTTNAGEAVAVKKLEKIQAISAGAYHSLASRFPACDPVCEIFVGTAAEAWGANELGQLGNGATTKAEEPVEVKSLTDILAISAGGHHSLAIGSP